MKKLATDLPMETPWRNFDVPEPIPFFGFVTGVFLSAAMWLGIGVAVWVAF